MRDLAVTCNKLNSIYISFRCGYQKVDGKVITKHDKELNQRTNGKRMMAMAPGIQTGDGGAFDMYVNSFPVLYKIH